MPYKRYEKDGWIHVSVKGSPREIGFGIGSALHKEIDNYIKKDLNAIKVLIKELLYKKDLVE